MFRTTVELSYVSAYVSLLAVFTAVEEDLSRATEHTPLHITQCVPINPRIAGMMLRDDSPRPLFRSDRRLSGSR